MTDEQYTNIQRQYIGTRYKYLAYIFFSQNDIHQLTIFQSL